MNCIKCLQVFAVSENNPLFTEFHICNKCMDNRCGICMFHFHEKTTKCNICRQDICSTCIAEPNYCKACTLSNCIKCGGGLCGKSFRFCDGCLYDPNRCEYCMETCLDNSRFCERCKKIFTK